MTTNPCSSATTASSNASSTDFSATIGTVSSHAVIPSLIETIERQSKALPRYEKIFSYATSDPPPANMTPKERCKAELTAIRTYGEHLKHLMDEHVIPSIDEKPRLLLRSSDKKSEEKEDLSLQGNVERLDNED